MRTLTADDIPAWVEQHLLSPTRDRPIVAVPSHPRTDRAWVDAEALQRGLGNLAEDVFLETGEPTWALRESLPPRLDVYGGAMRVWWPGLTRESNPYDHRLYFAYSAGEAERAVRRLEADVRERAGESPPAPVPAPSIAAATTVELPLEPVTVTAVDGVHIEVESADRRGLLKDADLPLDLLAASIEPGSPFQARPVRRVDDGTWDLSIAGLLPNLWGRFADEVRVGDVVTGRVQNMSAEKKLVFVDAQPVMSSTHGTVRAVGGIVARAVCTRLTIRAGRVDTRVTVVARQKISTPTIGAPSVIATVLATVLTRIVSTRIVDTVFLV